MIPSAGNGVGQGAGDVGLAAAEGEEGEACDESGLEREGAESGGEHGDAKGHFHGVGRDWGWKSDVARWGEEARVGVERSDGIMK